MTDIDWFVFEPPSTAHVFREGSSGCEPMTEADANQVAISGGGFVRLDYQIGRAGWCTACLTQAAEPLTQKDVLNLVFAAFMEPVNKPVLDDVKACTQSKGRAGFRSKKAAAPDESSLQQLFDAPRADDRRPHGASINLPDHFYDTMLEKAEGRCKRGNHVAVYSLNGMPIYSLSEAATPEGKQGTQDWLDAVRLGPHRRSPAACVGLLRFEGLRYEGRMQADDASNVRVYSILLGSSFGE